MRGKAQVCLGSARTRHAIVMMVRGQDGRNQFISANKWCGNPATTAPMVIHRLILNDPTKSDITRENLVKRKGE